MSDNQDSQKESKQNQSGISKMPTDFTEQHDDFEDDYDGFDDDDDEYDDDGIVVLEDNFEEVETDSSDDSDSDYDDDDDDDHIFSSQKEIEFSQNSEYYSDLNQKVFPSWSPDEFIGKNQQIFY
ncbi:hypothetical protein M0811_01551 [Anaeramoeba ignava]|uniref:Uncharacterized protein n=1 Tax=Anaeramoeba ignava TaxID=1746090 RepID=A0A9Q0RA22_ANAIG|nr:hypothetical protein M0811_01551 [Anaeramoeba ignava]